MGTLQSQTGKLAAVLLIGLAVSLAISSFIGRYKDHIAHASGRIPSREIVPAGRIFPPFFSAHGRSRTSFPVAFVCVSGNGKVLLLVVGRVRFLVKPTFFAGSLLV
jgi:hypothetical protein